MSCFHSSIKSSKPHRHSNTVFHLHKLKYQKPHSFIHSFYSHHAPPSSLCFHLIGILFGTALAAPKKGPPDFSNPPVKDSDEPQSNSNKPNTGGGPSGGTGQDTCPSQTYDPSGLFCNVNSGSFIHPLTFCPSVFRSFSIEIHALSSLKQSDRLTKLVRLHGPLFSVLCLCELDPCL